MGAGVEDSAEEDGKAGAFFVLEFFAEEVDFGGGAEAEMFKDHAGMDAGFLLFPVRESEPSPLGGGVAGDVAVEGDGQLKAGRRVAAQIVFFKAIAIYESVQSHRQMECPPDSASMSTIIGRKREG